MIKSKRTFQTTLLCRASKRKQTQNCFNFLVLCSFTVEFHKTYFFHCNRIQFLLIKWPEIALILSHCRYLFWCHRNEKAVTLSFSLSRAHDSTRRDRLGFGQTKVEESPIRRTRATWCITELEGYWSPRHKKPPFKAGFRWWRRRSIRKTDLHCGVRWTRSPSAGRHRLS